MLKEACHSPDTLHHNWNSKTTFLFNEINS